MPKRFNVKIKHLKVPLKNTGPYGFRSSKWSRSHDGDLMSFGVMKSKQVQFIDVSLS